MNTPNDTAAVIHQNTWFAPVKRYNEIGRPWVFRGVVAGYRLANNECFTLHLGECYSDYNTGPNLQELADYVGALTGAVGVWLVSFESYQFRK